MPNYITKRGYFITMAEYPDEKINSVIKELTVKPKINEDFGGKPIPFKVYRKGDRQMILPKFYGIKKFGEAENRVPDGDDIEVEFEGELRSNQLEPLNKTLEVLNTTGGGLLSLHCGAGKTVLALNIISKLKKKTLIVVNQEFLMDQWIERIKQFLPNMKVGKIQRDKIEVEDYDISLAMLKSLASRKYEKDTFDSFGFVIVDECHNIATKEYSKALQKINSKYMLGLSATPTRVDGLTKVIKWYIGDIFYKSVVNDKFDVQVERYIIKSSNKQYTKVDLNWKKKPLMARMINNVAEYSDRIDFIADKIKEITKDKTRQILLLSDRKSLLNELETRIKDSCECGFFIGGMKSWQRELSMDKQVILATFHIAREALDIKSLNTLILATPKSNIVQAVGRILRKKQGKHLIVDIVDNFSIFGNQGYKRMNYYKKKDYNISTFEVDLELKNCINLSEPASSSDEEDSESENESENESIF
tara:strand:- start:1042 stop:2469 length:1428 start_codon:yes stop_codon:yes gene_type:complete